MAYSSRKKEVLPSGKMRSKAPIQNLHMTDENKEMVQEMLQDLQVESSADHFEFEDIRRDERYWGKIVDKRLQIQDVIAFTEKDDDKDVSGDEVNPFALKKLIQCGFEKNRCLNYLAKFKHDLGVALENLLRSCCEIENIGLNNPEYDPQTFEEAKQQRSEEVIALKSIYEEIFSEAIPDRLWTLKIPDMQFLEKEFEPSKEVPRREQKKPKKNKTSPKNVCKFFLKGNCRFGLKCKMRHVDIESEELPEDKHLIVQEKEVLFYLEVRFPEGSLYPFEPPLVAFYNTSEVIPPHVSLNITLRLSAEAKTLSESTVPIVFSLLSILEDREEMLQCVKMPLPEFSKPERNKATVESNILEDVVMDLDDKEPVQEFKKKDSKKEIEGKEKENLNRKLKHQFEKQQSSSAYKTMLENRMKLPAWNSKEDIIKSLQNHQVLVISGMTGCGKTTQIPQFILDVHLKSGRGSDCNIICTQPRRISALSVAERVATERADKLGDMVGYKIRLESKQSSSTRLLYCTTGILLRYLENDSTLKGISHVIVDEVHERTEESDFLMMVLRDLLMDRRDLRVVLMSATLNSKLFSAYFYDAPVIHIPGRTFPVQEYYMEDALEKTGFLLDPSSPYARPMKRSKTVSKATDESFKGAGSSQELTKMAAEMAVTCRMPGVNVLDDKLNERQIEMRYQGYSKTTISSLYNMDHEKTNYDIIVSILEWIVRGKREHPNSGAILVFLSGMAEITTLLEQLNTNILFKDKGKFLILPLHSTLSSEEQGLIFKRPKEGVTKIVLSTNIAETSVTIDDIVYVIDCGKMKENRYDSSKGMESLEETWVSRANARQRRGRAGRVTSGVCFHLFTSHRYEHVMAEHQIPEIMRIPLEKLCLRIKIMTLFFGRDVKQILNKLLEPPEDKSITDALARLHSLGALDTQENLTSLGYHLAALPVDVRIGKLMLLGAIFCCVDPVLTIAASLSYKSPFVAPFDKRDEADKKKKEFSTGYSDHLTLLKAYKKWLEEMARGAKFGYRFCQDNFLSMKTLQMIASLKCQFAELLADIGFLQTKMTSRQLERLSPRTGDGVLNGTGPVVNSNADNLKLLLGVLCGALYPNVVHIVKPATKYKASSGGAIPLEPKANEIKFWTKNEGQVFIHPKSVNFDVNYFESPYLIYHEKVKTSKVFIRDTSMVSVYALLLFCGDSLSLDLEKGALVISIDDGWVRFTASSQKIATLVRDLRGELDRLLAEKIESPSLDLITCPRGSRIIDTIGRLIANQ
ncbi:putative ATP-dependent RNA helicase DHX57 isoform X2 [Actinia tenebrosa]|uniref:Putative ATP-dependent RNA helicase DHX57 n=1 Tax=Actinia tenebrosa TaxID=6105 RepID=A0A6P8HC69_ACTTE|nr:putative ATP-dependent RNA helicase DHX57 isoform X2 [Actinia tenebrosa]